MSPKRNKPFRRVLVTAGPTREMLDPVRFITNLSTGEMGYALAREAKRQGYEVTLLWGTGAFNPPPGIRSIPFVTITDLERALEKHFFRNDVLIMAAAVGDFIPLRRAVRKIHRQRRLKVEFRRAPDLVQSLARRKGHRVVIGFSLETENWLSRSQKKLRTKSLDGIVANFYTRGHNPFGKARPRVAFVSPAEIRRLNFSSKPALAKQFFPWIERLKKYS